MKRYLLQLLFLSAVLYASANIVYTSDTTNVVAVTYSGSGAVVTISNNIKQYISASENGADISIVQSELVSETTCGEITYQLSGTTFDGSFLLSGSYKATLELFGVSITNSSGPAIDIQNGKRIDLSCKKGTTSTLTDGTSTDEDAWKGALQCKGHLEFKGKGILNVYGNYAHAIWSKEYIEMKNCTINVYSAQKDAINCNQYFMMESGLVNLSGFADDGIQVSKKNNDTSAENTGNFIINGGTININMSGSAGESLHVEGSITKNSGNVNVINTTQLENTYVYSGKNAVYTLWGTYLGIMGEYEISTLPQGIYIVNNGNDSKKIVVL